MKTMILRTWSTLSSLFLLAGSSVAAENAPLPELREELQTIVSGSRETSSGSRDMLELVRHAMTQSPQSAWASIRQFLTDESVPAAQREAVFKAALSSANVTIRGEMIDLAEAWVRKSSQARTPSDRDPGYIASLLLVEAATSKVWAEALERKPEETNAMLTVAASGALGSYSQRTAETLLDELSLPDGMAGSIAAQAILSADSFSPEPRLARHLKPDDLEFLRASANAAIADGPPYPYAAIATLAHLGDQQTLALLDLMQDTGPSQAASSVMEWWRQMVHLQADQNTLVAYLAEEVPITPQHINQAEWALRRAAEIGVPRKRLADACLAAFERVPEPIDQVAAGILARAALELQVLSEEQMPAAIAQEATSPRRHH